MAFVGLGNLVVPEVQVVEVDGYEVLKQLLHQLDLFEVSFVLVVIVVNLFYKRKRIFNIQ